MKRLRSPLAMDRPIDTVPPMQQDIDKILIPQARIAQRVAELAATITADLQADSDTAELILVPILTGAMIFCCDLMRQIPIALNIGLFTVSSYPGPSTSPRPAQIISRQIGDIRGKNVLLLDDILDSGNTLRLVIPQLLELQPRKLRTCVLLRKQIASESPVTVDYVGFDIPDCFVVGYGLDYNNYYRNLPDIVTLKPGVTSARS